MGRAAKISILVLFLFAMYIPMLQHFFKPYVNEYTLHGSYTEAKDTSFTAVNWFEGNYQKKKELFVNENFGFREFFVRVDHEIDFSVFKDNNLLDVFKGKNDYYFNSSFFNTYSGRDYKGDAYADSLFGYIHKLNSLMTSRNKKLLVCFAPCKESFYEEYLPDSCRALLGEKNYYAYYKSKLEAEQIPVLDYNTYFLSIKEKSPHPLFVKGAVHWTSYGTFVAMDSLFKRVSHEIGEKTLLMKMTDVKVSDSPRGHDNDIYTALNLLNTPNDGPLAYPDIDYLNKPDSEHYKPKVMIIGDSFYMNLHDTYVPSTVFSQESTFLYYFLITLPYSAQKKSTPIEEFDLAGELQNTDIVILFFTIGRLDDFHFESTHKLFGIKK